MKHIDMGELKSCWLKDKNEFEAKNYIILDVRGVDEFNQKHIPGSINIPHTQIEDHIDQLKKYNQIFIHCKAGGRAQVATSILKSHGLDNITCVSIGGMDDWQGETHHN